MNYFKLEENVDRSELNIIILGFFNPVIITPFWLSTKNLIRETDAINAKIRIMHNEIVDYDLEWATIEITQKRFHIKCTQEPFFEITRDLVVGIFSLLKETPIDSFGFNHTKTVSLKTEDRYYEIGNRLSPFSNWSEGLDDPRLQRLEILDKESKQKSHGSILITIYSTAANELNQAVGININDHYPFSEKEGIKFSANLFIEYWDNSLNIANNVLSKLSNSLQL